MEEHNLKPEDLLFIGDNLQTDIKFANTANVDSFLVLTGVTSKENMEQMMALEGAGNPTYIGENLDFEEVKENEI